MSQIESDHESHKSAPKSDNPHLVEAADLDADKAKGLLISKIEAYHNEMKDDTHLIEKAEEAFKKIREATSEDLS